MLGNNFFLYYESLLLPMAGNSEFDFIKNYWVQPLLAIELAVEEKKKNGMDCSPSPLSACMYFDSPFLV